LRIATVQFAPVLGDPAASVAAAIPLVEEALEGADLAILPELADTGYDLGSARAALELASPIDVNPLVGALARICSSLGRHAVAGICEREGDRVFNTAALVGPAGLLGRYRKLHLFMNERDLFAPGDLGLPVFDIGPCRVGMLICFDWAFPEAWRCLALDGADLICHPSNLVLPYAGQATLVHALVNRVYVATANRIGAEGDLAFTGASQIAGPDGRSLAGSPADAPHVAFADIDVARARDKRFTARNDALEDRRPDQYRRILG